MQALFLSSVGHLVVAIGKKSAGDGWRTYRESESGYRGIALVDIGLEPRYLLLRLYLEEILIKKKKGKREMRNSKAERHAEMQAECYRSSRAKREDRNKQTR